FAEVHLVILNEQLHAENAVSTKRLGDRASDAFGLEQRRLAHRLWLPGFTIIAVFLAMTNRLAEACSACVAHSQQGNFEIEIHEALDNHASLPGTTALLGMFPGRPHVIRLFQ